MGGRDATTAKVRDRQSLIGPCLKGVMKMTKEKIRPLSSSIDVNSS
jgi:hypothetical protein